MLLAIVLMCSCFDDRVFITFIYMLAVCSRSSDNVNHNCYIDRSSGLWWCVQAATKTAWPHKHQSLLRTPWKSVGTLIKKTLAEAAKNASGRLAHWHALDTLHNVLTHPPDDPIHDPNLHTHTFVWNSPISPQLMSKAQHAATAPLAVAAVAAAASVQATQPGLAAAAPRQPAVPYPAAVATRVPAAPPLDISGALMKKAEMLTRVNKTSAELAHRAQQHLDTPTSQFIAIKFFLAAIHKAVDERKDEEWLQARLFVALLAVGGEPVWGRGASKANVEAVGYVYQLLTIKVPLLSLSAAYQTFMLTAFVLTHVL